MLAHQGDATDDHRDAGEASDGAGEGRARAYGLACGDSERGVALVAVADLTAYEQFMTQQLMDCPGLRDSSPASP